jgi:hypothetical protein
MTLPFNFGRILKEFKGFQSSEHEDLMDKVSNVDFNGIKYAS